ncbi:hypothetical protein ACFL52_01260 [Candidatus Margulisiibacteriota bacterium]
MKRKLSAWLENFLDEDMELQVKVVQRVAVYGFILFILVGVYLWQYKILITLPYGETRKIYAEKNIFELLIEKR